MNVAGVIEEVSDGKATVDFMHHAGDSTFCWPQAKDKQELPLEELLCHLSGTPFPVSSRLFKFDQVVVEAADKALHNVIN